jgi:hypothetical protein
VRREAATATIAFIGPRRLLRRIAPPSRVRGTDERRHLV